MFMVYTFLALAAATVLITYEKNPYDRDSDLGLVGLVWLAWALSLIVQLII